MIDNLKMTIYASLFGAMIAAGAYIAIPIGPVPIVLQNLFVLLAALVLGGKWAAVSVGIYLIAGIAGLPVFAGGTGGIARFAGPTGGYLVGFFIAAYIAGTIASIRKKNIFFDFLAMTIGSAIIYATGVTWLKIVTGIPFEQAIVVGVYPFLLGDAIKIVVAIPIARAIRMVVR